MLCRHAREEALQKQRMIDELHTQVSMCMCATDMCVRVRRVGRVDR